MEKTIYIITGELPCDSDKQILTVCDNIDAVKRAIVYFLSNGYENLEYCRKPLKEYNDVDTMGVYYIYNLTCELKENLALGAIYYQYKGISLIEKTEQIGWSSGKHINGGVFFEVQLSLCLKNTLSDVLTKEERKMIKDKIIELSKGQIWCEVKEIDLW